MENDRKQTDFVTPAMLYLLAAIGMANLWTLHNVSERLNKLDAIEIKVDATMKDVFELEAERASKAKTKETVYGWR